MKLAILAQFYLLDETAPINGSLVQLYNLSKAFSDNGVEVHYICMTNDAHKPQVEIQDGVHFYWILKKNSFLEWRRTLAYYKKRLHAISPDAVYVRGRNVLQYVAGNYANTHKKVYVWGTNGDDSAEQWKNIKRLKNSKKSILKKALLFPLKALEDVYINKGMTMPRYIVNQNTYQKEQTAKLLRRDGIILNSYYYIHKNKNILSRDQVLWLARWSKEKQPELFIELVSKLKETRVNFVLAGDTTDVSKRQSIIDRAKTYHIDTPGKISYKDVNACFSKSLVFVNTSYREGVSNTFIEAMLNGVPVFSLNSNPNNWLTDYNIGYCANGNIDNLAQKLNELLNDGARLKTMSDDAKIFAEERFSNHQIIKSYISLFRGNA